MNTPPGDRTTPQNIICLPPTITNMNPTPTTPLWPPLLLDGKASSTSSAEYSRLTFGELMLGVVVVPIVMVLAYVTGMKVQRK